MIRCLTRHRPFTDLDVVAAGATAMLTDPFGYDSTPARRRLIGQVVGALRREVGRFVVASPHEAYTVGTAGEVVAISALFGDAVVTVVDLHRSTPPVVAALRRLTGAVA